MRGSDRDDKSKLGKPILAARVSEIRAVQAEQSASRRRLDDLFQSMLYRAFEEEL
jgi:hypothetical protein